MAHSIILLLQKQLKKAKELWDDFVKNDREISCSWEKALKGFKDIRIVFWFIMKDWG